MKTKFYWIAMLASAALIAPAQAGGGGHGAGGGGRGARGEGHFGGGGFSPSMHSMPVQSFGGGRMIYSGQRFSAMGPRQFTPGNISRAGNITRSANGSRAINARSTGQVRNGTSLPSNWRNHVVAQHSANWQRNWDRNRDHIWHGHHCRFINGSWVIFDFGFYPWWPYWSYPYDYYGYGYGYPYGYDPDYYDSGAYSGSYDDQSRDSIVGAAQQELAQQGYYRGKIDGVIGPQTHRAITRYQANHGLRPTGVLTPDTVQALGLPRVASY